MTQVPGGPLLADFVPDPIRMGKDIPEMRWVANPRVDPAAPLPSQVWITFAACLMIGLLGGGIGVGLGSLQMTGLAAFILLLGVGSLVAARGRRSRKEPSGGTSWMTGPKVPGLQPLEEALRVALQSAGIGIVADHRRGWLGRGFEWRLERGMGLGLSLAGMNGLPSVWLRTRRMENRPAHQALKGHIQAAMPTASQLGKDAAGGAPTRAEP